MDDKKLINFPWEDQRLSRKASQFYSNFLANGGEELFWPFGATKQKVYFVPEVWDGDKLAFLLLGKFNQEFKYEREHYGKEGVAFPQGCSDIHLFHCLQRSEVGTEELSDRILAEIPHSFMQRDKVRFCHGFGDVTLVFSDIQLEAALKEYLIPYCWGVISSGSFLGRDEMVAFRTPYAYYQNFVDVKTAVQVHVLEALMREATRTLRKKALSGEAKGFFDFSQVFFPAYLSSWKGEYEPEEEEERLDNDSLFIQGFNEEVVAGALVNWLGEAFVTRELVPLPPDGGRKMVFRLKPAEDFADALQARFPWLTVALDVEDQKFFIEDAEKVKGDKDDV